MVKDNNLNEGRKMAISLWSALLFLIIASPIMFKATGFLFSKMGLKTQQDGCPNWWGLIIHACVFVIFIRLLMLIPLPDLEKYNVDNVDLTKIQRQPQENEYDFDFKKMCRENDGTLHLYKSMDQDLPFSGTLLSCDKRGEYGTPEVIIASELQNVLENIKNGKYSPKTEKERLILYLELVYPNSGTKWKTMSEKELLDFYQDLEFYYKLPEEIMPQTKIIINRTKDSKFYRVPTGVILDQDPNRLGITTPYVEVTRFGPTYSLLRDPEKFNGTYYYPAKGSGLFLPLGKTLIGYNKVHVLKMLDVPNTDIVRLGGVDFQYFLKKDSEAIWKKIVATKPDAKAKDYWVSACVVGKHLKNQDPSCTPYLGVLTSKIWYIPEALNTIINEMVSGKSLRIVNRKQKDGNYKDIKVYYGLGDTGDKFLSQIARDRSYDTLQFLREAQMSLDGDAIVGNEFLHLIEPIYSQASLLRLNPLIRPYKSSENSDLIPKINYLLDSSIEPVNVKMLSDGVFDPWEKDYMNLNIVVSKRN